MYSFIFFKKRKILKKFTKLHFFPKKKRELKNKVNNLFNFIFILLFLIEITFRKNGLIPLSSFCHLILNGKIGLVSLSWVIHSNRFRMKFLERKIFEQMNWRCQCLKRHNCQFYVLRFLLPLDNLKCNMIFSMLIMGKIWLQTGIKQNILILFLLKRW